MTLRSRLGMEPVYIFARRKIKREFKGEHGGLLVPSVVDQKIYVECSERYLNRSLDILMQEGIVKKKEGDVESHGGKDHTKWDSDVQVFDKNRRHIGKVVRDGNSYVFERFPEEKIIILTKVEHSCLGLL